MMGLRRRTVVEWFRVQGRYRVMYNCNNNKFQIRDLDTKKAVGGFDTWDDAIEWAFDFTNYRNNRITGRAFENE